MSEFMIGAMVIVAFGVFYLSVRLRTEKDLNERLLERIKELEAMR